MELNLIHIDSGDPYAILEDTKYTNFTEISQRIYELFDSFNKKEPIILKIYSQEYPNIKLIDLPGIPRIPIGDCPSNTKMLPILISQKYINDPLNVILCTISAPQSYSSPYHGFSGLRIAKEAEYNWKINNYLRRICIVTKINAMDLQTDAKNTLVAAINEVDSHTDTNTSNIGTLTSLTTDAKNNLVAAINEIDSHADTNAGDIADIKDLIPGEATSSNQLADKDFVNSSIASQTGNFIGTFPDIPSRDAYTGTVTNNDYCYVINSVITDNGNDWASFASLDAYDKNLVTNFDYAWVIDGSKFDLYRFDIVNQVWEKKAEDVTKEEITLNNAYNRYKAIVTTSPASLTWEYEYTLNNSSFTASQWAAINSGATTTNIGQITTNQNAIGTLNSLTTSNKSNLVSAINELNSNKLDANSTAMTAGTYTKVTVDAKGLVTAGTTMTLSDITDITATAAEVNILDGVTANASELNILDGATLTTTELNYVDGVTSSIQTQLDNKVAKTSTASQVYGTDANGNQTTYGKDDFGKVDDVKVGTTSVVTNKVANLGTMAGESKDDYQPTITGAATSITSSNLTVNKALISDNSGKVAASSVSSTELGYLSGVTSAIQTQINGKVSKSGDTLTQAEWGDSLTTHTIDASLHDTELDEVVGTTSLGWKVDPTDSDSVVEHLVTLPMADIEGGVKYVYTDVFGSLTFVNADGTKTKYTKGKIVNTTTNGGTSIQVNYSLPSKITDSTLATTSDIGNATITFKANGSTIVGQSFTTNATSDVEIDLGNTGLVDDVKINNTSIVTNKIASIPLVSSVDFGAAKIDSTKGISATSGILETVKASDAEIVAKTNNYKVIVPSTVDKAIMEGLGNYGGTAWTDGYKYTARDTIGATQVILKDWD